MELIKLFNNKEARVIDIFGYDDGYYWEYTIKFVVDDEQFIINIAGSFSGYIERYEEITKQSELYKLSGIQNNSHKVIAYFSQSDAVEEKIVISSVEDMYKKFIESGAKINYISMECDGHDEILIDRSKNGNN